jgi:hypothetical protein
MFLHSCDIYMAMYGDGWTATGVGRKKATCDISAQDEGRWEQWMIAFVFEAEDRHCFFSPEVKQCIVMKLEEA